MRSSRRLLQQVLSLPTAPMHEAAVALYVRTFARQHGLVVRADSFGNLLVRTPARGRPRVIFMAHMDHPAGEVVRCRGRMATVEMLGKLEPKQISRARWRFFADGHVARGSGIGRLKFFRQPGSHGPRTEFAVRLGAPVPVGTFGMLDLPPVRFVKSRVYARAIDNIANCAVILDVLAAAQVSHRPVMGILTRSEETNCAGAKALLRQRVLPRGVPIVVLEASSAKAAKVTIGAGPVIRVGDRVASFDPIMDLWLRSTASTLAKEGFRYQRALMPGGMTEATYYVMDGLMVGALAIPLGNYHNRGRTKPVPEVIAWRDWLGMRRFLLALTKAPAPHQVAARIRRNLWR